MGRIKSIEPIIWGRCGIDYLGLGAQSSMCSAGHQSVGGGGRGALSWLKTSTCFFSVSVSNGVAKPFSSAAKRTGAAFHDKASWRRDSRTFCPFPRGVSDGHACVRLLPHMALQFTHLTAVDNGYDEAALPSLCPTLSSDGHRAWESNTIASAEEEPLNAAGNGNNLLAKCDAF